MRTENKFIRTSYRTNKLNKLIRTENKFIRTNYKLMRTENKFIKTNNKLMRTENKFIFIYLGFYIAFNTVQVISRRAVGRVEETSIYSWSRFCTVNCRSMASNYQLSHLGLCRETNPGLRRGRQECYHSAIVAPENKFIRTNNKMMRTENIFDEN